MNIEHMWAVYFSPTGGTKTVVCALAERMGKTLQIELSEIDFTAKQSREKTYTFSEKDLVIIGSPVYAGRMPNKIMPDYKNCFIGNGALAVPVVVYGNRSYGDALVELRLLLQEAGFGIVGAAAMVSRHAFSDALANGRPDADDLAQMDAFAEQLVQKIAANGKDMTIILPADTPIEPYYVPKQEDGTPAKFLAVKPLTDMEKCDACGLCARLCPMGSIDLADAAVVDGICIKCQACVRGCPKHAKYFDDAQFLSHVRMLEQNFTARAENCLIG